MSGTPMIPMSLLWWYVLDAAAEYVDEVERCQGDHGAAHDEYLSLLRAVNDAKGTAGHPIPKKLPEKEPTR